MKDHPLQRVLPGRGGDTDAFWRPGVPQTAQHLDFCCTGATARSYAEYSKGPQILDFSRRVPSRLWRSRCSVGLNTEQHLWDFFDGKSMPVARSVVRKRPDGIGGKVTRMARDADAIDAVLDVHRRVTTKREISPIEPMQDRIKLTLLDYIYSTSGHRPPALETIPSNSPSRPFGIPCTRPFGARPSSSTRPERPDREQLDEQRVELLHSTLWRASLVFNTRRSTTSWHLGGPPVGTAALDAYVTRSCSGQLTIASNARNTSNKNPLRMK
jgi:hypothetical protein